MLSRILSVRSKRFAVVSLIPLLASCALAPGMRFDSQRPLNPEDPDSAPTVTPITLDLVRAEKAAVKPANQGVADLFGTPEPYRVGPGDILSIVVWDHPELVFPTQTYSIGTAYEIPTFSGAANVPGYVVSTAGDIQFPYTGMLPVAGKTQNQIREELSKRLAKNVKDPQVTVRVLAFRSQRIYLDGEVKTPGPQNIDDVPMTLLEALNRAGGINVKGGDNSRILVTRSGKNYVLSLPALLQQGVDPARILLRAGDLVRVESREDSKVFVTGEVVKPTTVLPRNGRLTLSEAIGDAGGVNPTSADAEQIYVIRKREDGEAQVFHLNGKSPVAFALAEGFELKPKDVVYVDAGGLVRWSRAVNLLIPTPVTSAASLAK